MSWTGWERLIVIWSIPKIAQAKLIILNNFSSFILFWKPNAHVRACVLKRAWLRCTASTASNASTAVSTAAAAADKSKPFCSLHPNPITNSNNVASRHTSLMTEPVWHDVSSNDSGCGARRVKIYCSRQKRYWLLIWFRLSDALRFYFTVGVKLVIFLCNLDMFFSTCFRCFSAGFRWSFFPLFFLVKM